MSQWYYILKSPSLLKRDINALMQGQRTELQHLGQQSKPGTKYRHLASGLYERLIPRVEQEDQGEQSLSELLDSFGFDAEMHKQIKANYKSAELDFRRTGFPSAVSSKM